MPHELEEETSQSNLCKKSQEEKGLTVRISQPEIKVSQLTKPPNHEVVLILIKNRSTQSPRTKERHCTINGNQPVKWNNTDD